MKSKRNALETERKVEFGLVLLDSKKYSYSPVRSKMYGGVRFINIRKNSAKKDILEIAKSSGTSAFASETEYEYECELMDYKQVILEEGINLKQAHNPLLKQSTQ